MKKERLVHLYTEDGEKLSKTPWDVYPRPQLKRDSFLSLSGEWNIKCNGGLAETVTVPFAPESLLSGICRSMGKAPFLEYERKFSLPKGFINERVILHFGAVDQIATVSINGTPLGEHRGGYLPFSFDITDYIRDENILTVTVSDENSKGRLPYGKQRYNRGGMWYTPVSGIWQSVWLESVPENYIKSLRIETGEDYVSISAEGVRSGELTVMTPSGEIISLLTDGHALIKLENPRLWSPESPYLYEFTLCSGKDCISSYFALRTLTTETFNGIPRLCLNGKPYFFHALLDQGYFSDGIYTPASPKCYENDILTAKRLGFNTLRKHIKIEPELFYYYCDKYGMIVFQDMVNNSGYSFLRDTALPTVFGFFRFLPDKWLHRNKNNRAEFEKAMVETVTHLYNHPCICYWTVFNEGWGQFYSEKMYKLIKSLDCTRFIDTASGWFSGAPSDVVSPHVYFRPVKIKPSKKPTLLSEFGGYSYKVREHSFNLDNEYGYRIFKEREAFEDALEELYENEIIPAIRNGLCGSVYTQLSDVEDETNGLITYDRRVLKVTPERMLNIAKRLSKELDKSCHSDED